jgi:hypothetical protein
VKQATRLRAGGIHPVQGGDPASAALRAEAFKATRPLDAAPFSGRQPAFPGSLTVTLGYRPGAQAPASRRRRQAQGEPPATFFPMLVPSRPSQAIRTAAGVGVQARYPKRLEPNHGRAAAQAECDRLPDVLNRRLALLPDGGRQLT